MLALTRFFASLSFSFFLSLSLSFSPSHTHTHSHTNTVFTQCINCAEIDTRRLDRTALLGTRNTSRKLSAGRRFYREQIDTNRLSCTHPSKTQSRRHHHRHRHRHLSTAVGNRHLRLLRARTCTNRLWCTRLFDARSTPERRRRRRRRPRTSVQTRAKTCNSLLWCTRLFRTRNTSAYLLQTSLSSQFCTPRISSACFPTLSKRKTLARQR